MAVELDLGRPTILKIDVEGEEAAVLRGARRLLGSDQALLVSTHSAELYQECRAILQPFGFRIYDSWEIARHLRDGTPWTSDHDMLAIGRDRHVEDARVRALELIMGPDREMKRPVWLSQTGRSGKELATTYSPTGLPRQYHPRGRA